jgi:thiamine-phosphate pyrophosphorylase
MDKNIFRIIDSNCNRCAEGLRLLEDIARMVLNDAALSSKLKTLRHDIINSLSTYSISSLSERDVDGDVGSSLDQVKEQNNLFSIIRANARRVEEGLRVLEEITKLSGLNRTLDSNKFKEFRFEIYKLEQELSSRVLRLDKVNYIKGVYGILDTGILKLEELIKTAGQMISGGSTVIQLRDKSSNKREIIAISRDLQKLCHEKHTLFIINDYPDIALVCDADGIHLGQNDLPVNIARNVLPLDIIIGCSVQSVEQANKAREEGADYVAVGSIFPTTTKEDINVVGLDLLKRIKSEIDIPVVAIGGIKLDNADEVIEAGADSLAIISAILNSDNIEETTRHFTGKFNL